jgi:hypothetical protein
LYRDIDNFKKVCQSRSNIVNDEKGDIGRESHSILDRWRKHSFQLFNVHGISDIRQTYIHTTELLVPEPSVFEVEMAIENLKRHKSPGIDQVPTELIKSGVGQFALRSKNLLMIVEALHTYSSGKTKESVRKCMQKVSSVAILLFCCICILILKCCLLCLFEMRATVFHLRGYCIT